MTESSDAHSNNSAEGSEPKKPGSVRRGRREARQYALQSLYSWLLTGNSVSDIQASMRAEYDFSKTDLEYYKELMKGVTQGRDELDDAMAPYIARQIEEVTPIEKSILYVAIYELRERLDVPFQVVLNEAIELTKLFGTEDAHKFVNAALDRLAPRLRKAEYDAYRTERGAGRGTGRGKDA